MKNLLSLGLLALVSASCTSTKTYSEKLLDNSLNFVDDKHGMIDPHSSYPVEGWNQDPERGLYLRSFTQLSAIGEYLELLANMSAGYCGNDYSQEDSLEKLNHISDTLLADQANPALSAKGLLVNFLDLGNGHRVGPLGEKISKEKFKKNLEGIDTNKLWDVLIEAKWIKPSSDGTWANILRSDKYGTEHFEGELTPYFEQRYQIMEVLDQRVVNIVFGDNVNLTASVAKAIGALLDPKLSNNAQANGIRSKLKIFLNKQKEGYESLIDPRTQSFYFAWDATNDTYTGWEVNGVFQEAHMNSFINEFRAPWTFVVLYYDLNPATLANAAFKIKPYPHSSGKDIYTLATWDGSAFQFLGLTNFLRDQDNPAWHKLMTIAAKIHLDFSKQNNLPGLLSESYTGNKTQYTGHVGLPSNCISSEHRITDAASLYALGVASIYQAEGVEKLLERNWPIIESLMTDHGPWEGYNTTQNKVIEFQTSAHTLALSLGLLKTGPTKMKRFLDHYKLNDKLAEFYQAGSLTEIDNITSNTLHFSEAKNFSNGQLSIRYSATQDEKVVLTFMRKADSKYGKMEMDNEIYLNFKATDSGILNITLPAVLSLHDISSIQLGSKTEQVKIENLTYKPFAYELQTP
ncbi:hypothetical protein PQO01_15205 [Lentisphaera marina]|uniref:hypothetical protein n=1 Tax=Lentisphaera marina TaxID=1111041 RepID=UPI00236547C7|nr:hypothetical protein [Lentisphaera marina]MDD7986297.1 hypothetical protein [Lentisphaera marina]